MLMTAVSRRPWLAVVVVGGVVSVCAGCGYGSWAPVPTVNASMAPASLPPAPPATPDCQGDVKAQQDIPHPTLGTVRVFLVLNPSPQMYPPRGCVSAVADNGKVLPPIPLDVYLDELDFANPVTDATGNAFIEYNPGRYGGVLVLIPTADGFEDIGWDQTTNTRYYGKRAYYYANLEGPGPDGRYTLRQFHHDCTPSCAEGTITSQDLHWNGTDYVP